MIDESSHNNGRGMMRGSPPLMLETVDDARFAWHQVEALSIDAIVI